MENQIIANEIAEKTEFQPATDNIVVNKIDKKRLSFYESGTKVGLKAVNDQKRETANFSETGNIMRR